MLWLGLLVLGWATASSAEDVYEVRDVKVDITAATAAEARDQALAQAGSIAFTRLLERITLLQDRKKLPPLSPRQVTALIYDFEVAEEKSSSVRYLARLNFRFRADRVRSLLNNYKLSFAETISKPVLILPVFKGEGSATLWGDSNPWREVWLERPPGDGLVSVIVPIGDLSDITALSIDQAVQGDISHISALAQRYGAGSTFVPYLTLKMDPIHNTPLVEISTARYGAVRQRDVRARTFLPHKDEDAKALMSHAARVLTHELETEWKRNNLMPFGSGGVVEAAFPIQNLDSWLEVRRKLEAVGLIKRVEVLLMSRDRVYLKLHHMGNLDQVGLALEQADLFLLRKGKSWILNAKGVDPIATPAKNN